MVAGRQQRFIDIKLYRFDVIRMRTCIEKPTENETHSLSDNNYHLLNYTLREMPCNVITIYLFLTCRDLNNSTDLHAPQTTPLQIYVYNLCHNHKITNQLHVYMSFRR